jgi:hypothetical protein
MSDYIENPFADYGSGIVVGERFIGRNEALKAIGSRVSLPRHGGNMAIIGEPRIGKSSLVHNALIGQKDSLTENRKLPLWIDMGTYENSTQFFRSLLTLCADELKELDWLTDPVELAYDRALEEGLSSGESYQRLQKFFQKIKESDCKIILVLDEFDHARRLFKDQPSAFQRLRELSNKPELRVNVVTISRRSIKSIEEQTNGSSTYDGIFKDYYLAMFDDEEVSLFFERMVGFGLELSEDQKSQVLFYCGGQPLLLEALGYEVFEFYRDGGVINIDAAAQQGSRAILSQYDRMLDLLRERENWLNKLLRLRFNPGAESNPSEIDEFLRYGLVRQTSDGAIVGFSGYFDEYLKVIERTTDLRSIWTETERALRLLITKKMLETYGDDWVAELETKYPKLKKTVFDKCRERQTKEVRNFGNRATQNLIELTYPVDLFDVIFADWSNFKDVLGKDPGYWASHKRLLGKVRTPVAHSRDELLTEYERLTAEGYCKEILSVVKTSTQVI